MTTTLKELGILDTVEERLIQVEAWVRGDGDGVRLDHMQAEITAEAERLAKYVVRIGVLETMVVELSQAVRQMARTMRLMGDLAVEVPMAPDINPC